MLTDRSPVEYRYLSRRLLREIVQSDWAMRRGGARSASFRVSVGGLSAEVSKSAPDYENLYELAELATVAVSDHSGPLGAEAPYLCDELDVSIGFVPIFGGWQGTYGAKVACIACDGAIESVGSVFVGLFGSTSNLVGWHEPAEIGPGWWPSDGVGVFGVLAGTREEGDVTIAPRSLQHEADLEPIWVLDLAQRISRGLRPVRKEKVRLLAKVHLRLEDVQLNGTYYDVALIGAPIWVRTPTPRPFAP